MSRQRAWMDVDIDPQWGTEQDGERTEEATPHRLRLAREEGMVARSAELPSAFVLLAGVVTVAVTGRSVISGTMELLRLVLSQATTLDITRDPAIVVMALRTLIGIVAPVAVVAFLSALASNLVQVGSRFVVTPIILDLRRIALRPSRYFRRVLFSAEAGFALAALIVRTVLVAGIVVLNIRNELIVLAGMVGAPLVPALLHVVALVFRIAVQTTVVLLLMGVADYLCRRLLHRKALRMSRKEVAEERRQLDGDPLVRRRLRERSRELPRIRR